MSASLSKFALHVRREHLKEFLQNFEPKPLFSGLDGHVQLLMRLIGFLDSRDPDIAALFDVCLKKIREFDAATLDAAKGGEAHVS